MPSANKFCFPDQFMNGFMQEQQSIENLSKIDMISSFQGSIEKNRESLYGGATQDNLRDRASL